jgi:myxalamid-type nonribosomal peptide synthetase MxaA
LSARRDATGAKISDVIHIEIGKRDDRRALPPPGTTRPALESSYEPPSTSTERTLARMFAALLNLDQVGAGDDFFALGGDSLLLVRLHARVREEPEASIPLRALIESPTVRRLAELLDSESGAAVTPASEAGLAADAVLDPAIRVVPERRSRGRTGAAIALTGATGYVGAFLLRELTRRQDAPVRCVVRAASAAEAEERLESSLAKLGIEDALDHGRIEVVVGDLAQPRGGAPDEEFHRLARTTLAVYHCGAWVNTMYPYSILRCANVGGTAEAIRLACLAGGAPLHFVSTSSVFDPRAHTEVDRIDETVSPAEPGPHLGGYAQSKWVAERLVEEAARRRLPASLVRLPLVGAESSSGAANDHDFVAYLVRASVRLGQAPDAELEVDVLPVDALAAAVVELGERAGDGLGVFHLPALPLPWSRIARALVECGAAETRPPAEWLARLDAAASEDEPTLARARSLLRAGGDSAPSRLVWRCDRTVATLSGLDMPHALDDAYVARWVGWLVRNGRHPGGSEERP